MRTLEQAGDLKGKRIFFRADFDVPVDGDSLREPFRIQRQREGLQHVLEQGARVVVGAHISAVPSFEPLKPELERILGVTFGDQVTLLENLRSDPGEKANDEAFAKKLAEGCDVYVNNAFAVCHRQHASVDALPRLLPSYAGPLIVEETQHLSEALTAPSEGKVVFMGGAKAATKVPVIKQLLDQASAIAVGGVIANDILKAQGVDIGSSRVDEDAADLLAGVDLDDKRLVVPTDHVKDGDAIFDIGPETAQRFASLAADASLIIWNGPMGKFEEERFLAGTKALAEAITASNARSIVGGGDTVAAVHLLNLQDQFNFVSTGGGAMLAFLAGEGLFGLKALGYYDQRAE